MPGIGSRQGIPQLPLHYTSGYILLIDESQARGPSARVRLEDGRPYVIAGPPVPERIPDFLLRYAPRARAAALPAGNADVAESGTLHCREYGSREDRTVNPVLRNTFAVQCGDERPGLPCGKGAEIHLP